MATWDQGYVTDIPYVNNHHRECTPAWIATAALLLGHRPPDLSRPFRYADLGCGNGFTALSVAATSPQAEVWAFDFNPAHIEAGRLLAAQAGLGNIHFVEASFADLRNPSRYDLPDFDLMVSHGVLSWISPENQAHLIATIGERLRPGGLAYVSYNVGTGWAAMVPVRRLMRMLAESGHGRSDQAAVSAMDYIDRLRGSGASFFPANPGIEGRLTELRKQDARYLAHEYMNRDWHPVMFADVADSMAEARCTYIGSATLPENIDAVSLPAGVVALLGETQELRLRETLRDFGANQVFRRDLYRRGTQPLSTAEHGILLDELGFVWTGLAAGEQVTFTTPLGTLTGRPEIYRPLLAILEAGPTTVAQARSHPAFAGRPILEVLQALTLLTSGGYAHPILPGGDRPEARAGAARLNRAMAAMNAYGGDMQRLAVPLMGTVVPADFLEVAAVAELLAGKPADLEALTDAALAVLGRTGRSVQREGQPVSDPVKARAIVTDALRTVLEQRLPLLRRWGVL